MPKLIEVGDVLSYPTSDHGFYYVCEIPFDVALSFIDFAEACADNEHTFGSPSWRGFWTRRKVYSQDSSECIYERSKESWMNKLALVVSTNEYGDRIMAVYKHDSKLWLIRKDKQEV